MTQGLYYEEKRKTNQSNKLENLQKKKEQMEIITKFK